MYEVKNTVFLDFTKRQRQMLFTFLMALAKNHQNLSEDELLSKFIEDETYYHEIGNPHFYFAYDSFENDDFIRDLKKYIHAIFINLEYKRAQKPFLERQKALAKEARKKASEYKMKHEVPSAKQLKYYKNLCKNHKIEPKELADASKYDLKIWISEILDKFQVKK